MGRGTRVGKERKRVEVAKALVAGELPSKIAPKLGCSVAYVGELAAQPETQNLAERYLSPHRERLAKATELAVAQVERQLAVDAEQRKERVAWLRDRIEKLQRVIAERGFFEAAVEAEAKKPAAPDGPRPPAVCPGGATGLLARSQKALGSGAAAVVVDEFDLDAALLKELREHERQLRDELNDFAPAMKGVERLCDLLELAQGGKREKEQPAGGFTLVTIHQLLALTAPQEQA